MKSDLQIEIRKAGDNEYYFLFRLPNGGIFISKFFEDNLEAVSTAEKTKRSAMEESCYQEKKETTNESYFIFNIKKNAPIGQSSIYKDKPSMEAGIHYMKNYLVEAEIIDLTT